jgi:hypothetical protein
LVVGASAWIRCSSGLRLAAAVWKEEECKDWKGQWRSCNIPVFHYSNTRPGNPRRASRSFKDRLGICFCREIQIFRSQNWQTKVRHWQAKKVRTTRSGSRYCNLVDLHHEFKTTRYGSCENVNIVLKSEAH